MDTTAPARGAATFAAAENVSTADELLDHLVAMRPVENRVIETKLGESEATFADVVLIEDDGTVHDLGQRPIFWTVVRRQLGKATTEVPWIVGRLVQVGQAYRLDAYTEAETPLISKALSSID